MKEQLLFNDIKSGLVNIDKLLYPEQHVSEFKLSELKIDIIPSGFPSLDDYKLLKDGANELIIVGGRPSHGKSAFMFQIAAQVAATMPVHVFSLEMDSKQLRTRLIAGILNKSVDYVTEGKITAKEETLARNSLSQLQYYIDDRSGMSVYHICDAARNTAKMRGTKLIVIDYLQMMKPEKSHSKDDEIGKITKALKDLAKELKVPIIVGSQLNRANETRGSTSGDYRPMLADLRESGNIEQDADLVMFVHRESRYTGERAGEADLIIAKNRNGRVGEVTMQFTEFQTKFIDRPIDSI